MSNSSAHKRPRRFQWWRGAVSALAALSLAAGLYGCAAAPASETPVGVDGKDVTATPGEPSPGSSPEPLDLTGERILIAQLGNMTGKGSEFVLPMIRGVQDAVTRANEEDGLFGAQLALETYNTAGEASIAGGILAHLRENVKPAAIVFLDAELIEEVLGELNSLEVPVLAPWVPLSHLQASENNYLFSLASPPDVELVYTIQFLNENWGTLRPAQAGEDMKLAVLAWPNAFGQAALSDDAREFLADTRIEVVFEGAVNASYAEDAAPALRQAIRAGANVLYIQAYAFGPAVVLNDYYWLGLQDQALVAGPSWAMDMPTYGYLTKPEYFNGFLAPSAVAWWSDSDNAVLATLLADLDESDRTPADKSVGRLIGFEGVGLLFQAIRTAVEETGGTDFAGGGLRAAIAGMEDIPILNGLATVSFSGPYQYSPYMQVRRVTGFGVFEGISAYEPFLDYP